MNSEHAMTDDANAPTNDVGHDGIAQKAAALAVDSQDAKSASRQPRGISPRIEVTEIENAVRDYRVVRTLSETPTSVVYKAEHKKQKRPVAIKVVYNNTAADPVRIERARVEIDRARHLDYPGIARLIDAGLTDDGHCYLISDYIKGVSLDAYVSVHKLSSGDRLSILTKICNALQYAHQRCTLHRDLRPTNIIIDGKCNPWIVGFACSAVTGVDIGVSDEIARKREFGEFLAYKSPEQIEGRAHDIDVRTDVYSMGVIAYELLTGTLPYHVKTANPKDFVQAITRSMPPKPSTVKGALRGDLEAILLKMLEKQPDSRYQSVAGILADLHSYFQERPISARSAGAFYEFRKLAARYRSRTISVAVMCVALFGFGWHVYRTTQATESKRLMNQIQQSELVAVGVASQLDAALEELDKARRAAAAAAASTSAHAQQVARLQANIASLREEAAANEARARRAEEIGERSHQVAAFFPQLFSPDFAGQLIGDDKAVAFLDEAARRAAVEFKDMPVLQASLYLQLATSYEHLRQAGKAAAIAKTALGMYREGLGERHEDTIAALNRVTSALFADGNYHECEPYARKLVDAARGAYGPSHPRTLTAMHNLGMNLYLLGKLDKAGDVLESTTDGRRAVLGPTDEKTATSIHALAIVRFEQGRHADAAALFRDEIAALQDETPGGHWHIADARSRLGACLTSLGQFEEAETMLLDSFAELRDTFGENHDLTRDARARIATMYKAWGREELAGPYVRG